MQNLSNRTDCMQTPEGQEFCDFRDANIMNFFLITARMDYFYQQIGMFESVIWHIFSHSFYNE